MIQSILIMCFGRKKPWKNNKIGAIFSGDILNTRTLLFRHNIIVEKGGAATQKYHMVETRSVYNFESAALRMKMDDFTNTIQVHNVTQ